MEEHNLKEIAKELFEAMDFGSNFVVGVEKWNIAEHDDGISADLSILVDYNNHPVDEPSAQCSLTVTFDQKTLKPTSCVCENEFGDVVAELNIKEYFAKKEAQILELELKSEENLTLKRKNKI